MAFLTACGGGIIRDLCLGIHPPVGISHWPYLVLTLMATISVAVFHRYIENLEYPVLLFDAAGLAMFAVAGTQKTLFLNHNYEVAILLGVLTAIGGGVIRDTLLGRIPVVLRKEVYGSAALIGAGTVAVFHFLKFDQTTGAWLGIGLCFFVRYISIKNKWNLPRI